MPEIPKGATVPDDHKKSAAQLEAEGVPTTGVEWRGHTFTVASDADDYPVEAILAFEKGQNFGGLEIILGEKGWARFMRTKPLKRDGISLFEAIQAALGLGD